ncbi:MAG: zinc-ribbon domain-containing protein [Methanomassiliicoccaceae archaeon]|jgi:TM2 domain-containing membrane protein YozV|nr:zinc-ribbon domain-containing protein [Methanomassiliicoccaceae archaeon]
MYCGKCGNEMRDGQEFCDKCGQKAGTNVNNRNVIYISEKSAGVAAVLSFLFAGLGQIYVGKIGRGLAIIALYAIFAVACSVLLIITLNPDDLGELLAIMVIMVIGSLIILIWNVYDAYKLANEYNDSLRATGNRPW